MAIGAITMEIGRITVETAAITKAKPPFTASNAHVPTANQPHPAQFPSPSPAHPYHPTGSGTFPSPKSTLRAEFGGGQLASARIGRSAGRREELYLS
jgi:hypothetical protein